MKQEDDTRRPSLAEIDARFKMLHEPIEPTHENLEIIVDYLNAHGWEPHFPKLTVNS